MNFLRSFLACFLLVVVVPVAGLYAADGDTPEGDGTQNCQNGQYYWDEENKAWASGGREDGQVCLDFPITFVYKKVLADSCELGNVTEELSYTPDLAQQSSLLLNPGNDKCYYSNLTVGNGLDIKAENAASTVDISKLTNIISSWSQNPAQSVIGTTSAAKKYVVKFFVDGAASLAWEQECTFYSECKLPTKSGVREKLKAYLNDKYFLASDVFTLYENGAVNTAIQLGYGENIQPYEDKFVQQNAQANIILNTGNGFKVNLGDCSKLTGNQYCKDYEVAPCGSGYYVSEDRLSCNTCEVGYYCPDGKEREMCAKGTYQDETEQSECKSCPAGAKCPGTGLTAPEYCTGSSYQNRGGKTSCEICPAGSYTSGEGDASGNTTCTSCPAGYYCPDGNNRKECSAGYYCPAGAKKQTECPAGSKCPDDQMGQPTKCESGTYQPNTGQQSCLTCEAGYYCPAGASEQTKCPAGASCSGGGSYTPCTGSKYQSSGGQGVCLSCEKGNYTSKKTGDVGNTQCSSCEAGYYCPGDGTAIKCSAGYYCPADAEKRTECPAGSKCPDDQMGQPTKCESGTYQPNTGQRSCLTCEAGYYCPAGTESLTEDLLCTAGYCCPEGTGKPETKCSAGYYCPTGSASCIAYEHKCTGLQSCPVGTVEPTNCPSGYYVEEDGTCEICPKGSYCPTEGENAGKKVDCDRWQSCNQEGLIRPNSCGVGQYPNWWGSFSWGGCTYCDKGYMCPDGKERKECAKGTYQDKTGQSECKSCPAGAQCPGTGLTAPEYCTGSSYQDTEGQTSCKLCPLGGYTSAEGEASGNTTCTSCPAGYYCPDGDEKITCSAERFEYCPENKTELDSPGKCEDGEYPVSVGTCTPCPRGSYCSGGRKDDCPAGAICPVTGLKAPTYYCRGSWYQDDVGQTSCKLCSLGSYTSGEGDASGNTTCTSCPRGSYCNGNEKKECPALFTSLEKESTKESCFIDYTVVKFCDGNNTSCYSLPVTVYYNDQQEQVE